MDGYSSSLSSSNDVTMPSNPIARARMAVQAIRGSGSHQDAFNQVIIDGNTKGWFKEGQLSMPA